MSSYYSMSAELKTWEPRFEPLLDMSQWWEYGGMDYVPDVTLRKIRKGRHKKVIRNEMDNMEKGYENDMYGSGNFDQIKNKACYSIFHNECHTMNRHKEGSKRNPRARGTTGRNHRSGATNIIEVTHMSNIKKLFILLVCSNIICCNM
jgi:hypothetical protein